MLEFKEFPKMARLSREAIITEKIDGTNAQVTITEDGQMFFGSRTRWLSEEADNFGFWKWGNENREELKKLGPGTHFGEWWGCGIQRGYGLKEKRFSLFNPRWMDDALRPRCAYVVPILCRGIFSTSAVDSTLEILAINGSYAAPGFMKPEGVVVYHKESGVGFKKTIEKDEVPKGAPRV